MASSRVHASLLGAGSIAGACACAGCHATALPDAPTTAWSQGMALPRPALSAGVAARGLEVILVGGFDTGPGQSGDITDRVDAYDSVADSWRSLTPAPVHWLDPGVASVGDTLYLAGGFEGAQRTARGNAFALDPLTGAWVAIAPLPAGDERGAAGVIGAPDRVILLGGASSTAVLDTCVDYNVATASWEALPALPAPRAHLAAMRRSDGWLIAGGGFASLDASDPRTDVWGLQPGAVAWQPLAAMQVPGEPDTPAGCAYGVVLGQLTCAGGASGATALDIVDSYDPFNNVWTPGERMPVERAGAQGAGIGGRLFVLGGGDPATGAPTQTLYIYAPLDTAPR